MEVDKEKIKKRFEEISHALEEIRRITSLDDEKFWADEEHIAAVKYNLLQAIEGVASICLHLAAKKFKKGVSNPGDCFKLLIEREVVDRNLAKRLIEMNRFRNMLVHHYEKIDDKKVLKYTREELDDFENFIRAVGEKLDI